MSITKSTSVDFITSGGVEFSTLQQAKYREMSDVFLSLFTNAGIPTSNNIAGSAATTLGQYFVDIANTTLTSINGSIVATRNANP